MAKDTIEFELEFNTKGTKGKLKNVNTGLRRIEKSVKDTDSAWSSFKGNLGAGVVLDGVKALARGVANLGSAAIDAAKIQEQSLKGLQTAMQQTGEFTQSAFLDMQNFASALQNTTTIGDETTLQMLSLAKSFGATNEQAKELITAAADYSSASGRSFEEAVRQLSKTLGGFAGELGEVNPAIKELTKEQLQAGAAARVLGQQFRGSAAANTRTFSGRLEQLNNNIGDFLEQVGFLITSDSFAGDIISGVSEFVQNLTKFFQDNRKEIKLWVKQGINLIIKAVNTVAPVIQFLTKQFLNQATIIANLNTFILKLVNTIAQFFEPAFTKVSELLSTALGWFSKLSDKIADFIGTTVKKLGDELGDTKKGPLSGFIEAAEKGTEKIEELRDAVKGADFTFKELDVSISAGANTSTSPVSVSNEQTEMVKSIKKQSKEMNKILDSIVNAFGRIFDGLSETTTKEEARDLARKNAGGAVAGVGGAVGGAIVSKFAGPQAGGAVGGILNDTLSALATGNKEGVKEMTKAFAEEIPQVIVTMAETFPSILEGIAEANHTAIAVAMFRAAPVLARGILESIPEITRSFMLAMHEAFVAIGNEWQSEVVPRLSNSFVAGFEDVFNNLYKSFENIFDFGSIGEKLIDSIVSGFENGADQLVDSIQRAILAGVTGGLSESGGGNPIGNLGGSIGNIGKSLGF